MIIRVASGGSVVKGVKVVCLTGWRSAERGGFLAATRREKKKKKELRHFLAHLWPFPGRNQNEAETGN